MSTISGLVETQSDAGIKVVGTEAARESSLASADHFEGWQQVIDTKLIEWGRAPRSLEDDGVTAPTPETITQAAELAQRLRDLGFARPDRVERNPDGGIVFEFGDVANAVTWQIDPDGSVSRITFRDSRVVQIGTILDR